MFHDAARLAANNWYLLLGALAAVAIPLWCAVLLRGRNRPVRTLRDKVAPDAHARQVDLDRMLNWLPQEEAERRRAPRRGGEPTAIRVAVVPTEQPNAADEALVLDRAAGGLCLAVERPFRQGQE